MPQEQQLPSIFLYIGEFDMTFPAISPAAYLERLNDEKRLKAKHFGSSRQLRLLPATRNNNEGKADPCATFALQHSTRGAGVWAIGTVCLHDDNKLHVAGKVGTDYRGVFLLLFIFSVMIVSGLVAKTPVVSMIKIAAIYGGYMCLILPLSLFNLKRKLLNYLRESNPPTQT